MRRRDLQPAYRPQPGARSPTLTLQDKTAGGRRGSAWRDPL